MDNNNLSKIPVSELTPENINSLKGSAPAEARDKVAKASRGFKSNNKKNRLPLIIIGVILLIGVAVAIFFIFRKPADAPSDDSQDDDSAEIIWEPEPDAENPSQDYIDHHQSTIDNPDATPEEKLDAKLSIANLYASNGEFEKANDVLSQINRSELNHQQMFNLYSVYAYLYECMGDTVNNQQYLDLARSELEKFWESEGE